MQFRKIRHYINRDTVEHVEHVNQRLEYFHHYWNFQFQQNTGFLLLANEKFESHRSLLEKITLQVEVNFNHCYGAVRKVIVEHPYFKNDNIIFREDRLSEEKIKSFRSKYSRMKPSEFNNREKVIEDISKIKKLILKDEYKKTVIDLLIKVLHENKPITPKIKKDIQSLINATIIELFHFGYSLDFIRKIPNIILFPSENKNDFPFDKNYSDFDTKEEYKEYQIEEAEKINLKQQITCLLNLLKPQKLKGYYIFKIDNIDFQLDSPLLIWGVTFYNPCKTKKIVEPRTGEWKRMAENDEMFLDFSVMEGKDENQKSTCNAFVKVKYRPLYGDTADNSLLHAIKKVEKSLHIFNRLHQFYIDDNCLVGKISLSKYSLTNEEFYGINVLPFSGNISQESFKLEPYQEDVFIENLEWINKLNPDIEFQKILTEIYAYHCKAYTDSMFFNFKDYWTVCSEALYPNQTEKFIKLCQDCFEYRIHKRLFSDAKSFLNNSLRSSKWDERNYTLNEEAKKKLDLYFPDQGEFDAEEFGRQYHLIKQHVDFEFLNDIIAELNSYKNNKEYLDKIKEWVGKTIWEVYYERNLEVHNNIQTDLSLLKLKDSFLFIIEIVYQVLSWNCEPDTESIEDILHRIREKSKDAIRIA